MKLKIILSLFLLVSSLNSYAGAEDYFKQSTHEFGLSNIGFGYSTEGSFIVEANTRYQYYIRDRIAIGGAAFYSNFDSQEWMGIGPTASYIFWAHQNWFSRVDQFLTAAKYSGFSDDPSSIYGTTSIGINYLPTTSNFFIGVGYAHSYALDSREVLKPNAIQLLLGWLWI